MRREIVDPCIADHNRRIVKTTGDGLLLEFASAVDAVRCMIEVQTAVVEKTADVPADRRILPPTILAHEDSEGIGGPV